MTAILDDVEGLRARIAALGRFCPETGARCCCPPAASCEAALRAAAERYNSGERARDPGALFIGAIRAAAAR